MVRLQQGFFGRTTGGTCQCESGYTLGSDGRCTTLTSTCGGVTCQNGATCSDINRCDCPPGYHGVDCSGEIE